MNKFVKIVRNDPFRSYIDIDGNDQNLDVFSIFLINDVGHGKGDRFRDWALDKKEDFISAGHTWLGKKNDKIYVYCKWFEEEDDQPRAELSIEGFVSGLDQWNELIKFDPKCIMLWEKRGKIKLEAFDSEQ